MFFVYLDLRVPLSQRAHSLVPSFSSTGNSLFTVQLFPSQFIENSLAIGKWCTWQEVV